MSVKSCVLLIIAIIRALSASPYIEGLPKICFAIQRDLNLAFFGMVTRPVMSGGRLLHCSTVPGDMQWLTTPAASEAFIYAINKVNDRNDLLPNISLGFIALDDCFHELAGLAVSMYLLPDQNDTDYFPDNELLTCSGGYKRFRNVVGTVGPAYSRLAVMNVPVLSLHHIPMLLTTATSDELSDKTRFPYSLRMVPPDRFQADAMTDLLLHFNWTYVSIIYTEGAYGENGAKQLHRNAQEKGICVAFDYMFPSVYRDEHVDTAVDKMTKYKNARVILAFVGRGIANKIAQVLIKRRRVGHFLWVGSDMFYWTSSETGKVFDGAFTVRFYVSKSEEFREHYHQLTPGKTNNPWLRYVWEKEHNCKLGNDTIEGSCSRFIDTPSTVRLSPDSDYGVLMDGVNVFAHALHALIENTCPAAFYDKSLLADCVQGQALLQYLGNTSMNGSSGPIRFDENGDSLGSYQLRQYHNDTGDDIVGAEWNGLTGSLIVHSDSLKWFSHLNTNNTTQATPESLCSRPCGIKQYYIQKELPCCWECRECRNNEIIVDNKTGCHQCDLLSWPDEETATVCLPIEPIVRRWSDPLSLGLLTLTCIGGLLCVATAFVFIKNRQLKIIKASSHQLMAIILVGIMVAFVTTIIFLLAPSIPSCFVTRFGFNVAVSLIYSPLVVKTSRVYRIFAAGKHGSRKPILIGLRSQMVMVAVLLLIQLLLCVASVFIAYPRPIYRMPVVTERYVEVHCNLPLPALLPPLSFNILLSMVCAAFGLVTRKLPANFNESWFIFVSVASTTFLWLVFLPAYFTAFYAVHRIVLLASCLFINGMVTLVCLYLPKVYCVYFVDESSLKLQTAGSIGTASVAPTTSGAVAILTAIVPRAATTDT